MPKRGKVAWTEPEHKTYVRHPNELPARVVYTLGGGLVPPMPYHPDQSPLVTATAPRLGKGGNVIRIDAFARMVARGASQVDAYCAAYNKPHTGQGTINRATIIANRPAVRRLIESYVDRLGEEGTQTSFETKEFVKARLVLEAQDAPESSSRIRALELLGKTEGMFVDVKRTEKTISPMQLEGLKRKVDQRLRQVLSRLHSTPMGVLSLDKGQKVAEWVAETPEGEAHPDGTPLNGQKVPVVMADTIPPTHGPTSIEPTHGSTSTDITPVNGTQSPAGGGGAIAVETAPVDGTQEFDSWLGVLKGR